MKREVFTAWWGECFGILLLMWRCRFWPVLNWMEWREKRLVSVSVEMAVWLPLAMVCCEVCLLPLFLDHGVHVLWNS